MTDSTLTPRTLQPGTLVWYAPKGLGRVTEAGDRLAVLFWSDGEAGKPETVHPLSLTPLPVGKQGTDVESWAQNSPLKVVALALSACGGRGGPADIKEKLDKRAPIGAWGNWWKRIQPKLGNLPEHFRLDENGGGTEYTLLSSIAEVPPDLTDQKVTLADWKNWLSSGTHDAPPGRFPTRQVSNALAKWPAKSIEQVLLRVIVSAEQALATNGASAQAAEGWLRAIAEAALRWRESGGNDPRGYTAARVGEVLARLAGIAGERTPQELLLQAGALDGPADAWRRGFLAGLWESFEGDDAREMYLSSSAILGRQARGDLVKEMFLSAFGPDFSKRRHAELDRLLDAVPESQRTPLLNEIIATAEADQRDGVLGYIDQSRHASGPENLALRLVATLTLGGEGSELATRTSRELANTLKPKSHSIDGGRVSWSFTASNPTVTVLRDVQGQIDEIMGQRDSELADLRKAHAAELERERAEQERLRQQVRERNAELAANREESRLEASRDMLLAVGEVFQSVCREQGSNEMADSVAAGLTLALQAGGAMLLESRGGSVDFDPGLHDSDVTVPPGTRVRVIAPGVTYRGGVLGTSVLLKAQVRHEAG